MDLNTHRLGLIFIFLHIIYLQMKKDMLKEILFLRRKDKKHQKKNLIVNLLELILVEKIMMHLMKLVE